MKLGFILSEMWAGIRSNFSMIVSIILVSFVSLTFLAVTMLLQLQITQMKTYWYDRAQVAIYLCSDYSPEEACPAGGATDNQKVAVKQQLMSDTLAPYIEDYYFETKDQAYEKFVEQFADSQAVQYITADQLNEAYWVNLKDPNQSDLIIESFSGLDGVEEIKDQRSYLDEIFSFLNAGSLLAAGVAGVMLLSATLLIATTIRLSAHSRRREISIMRLVGASKFSIQLPFVLEGVLAAVVGGLLASGVTVAITHYFITGFLAQQLAFTSFFTVTDALMITPYLLGVGAALAIVSSAVSIHRYLRT
jgi:cell division transport system permease protein